MIKLLRQPIIRARRQPKRYHLIDCDWEAGREILDDKLKIEQDGKLKTRTTTQVE